MAYTAEEIERIGQIVDQFASIKESFRAGDNEPWEEMAHELYDLVLFNYMREPEPVKSIMFIEDSAPWPEEDHERVLARMKYKSKRINDNPQGEIEGAGGVTIRAFSPYKDKGFLRPPRLT